MALGETLPEVTASTTIGNYVIERELGRGGMGAVYVGIHPLIGKRVAIKVLLPALSQQKALVDRFFTEAKAASQVKHAGIVEVNDYGVGPDGNAYIVMEYLEGESLASRLRSHGRLAVGSAVAIARQTALALAAAHRARIIHRDLKPDNMFLVPDAEVFGGERVKLLDFGIAKLADQQGAGAAQTVTGAILGTPQYMSPEQCEGSREIDHRSDLYSLGCTLFQMLAGRLPFTDTGIGGLIGAHLHMAPPRLRSLDPSIPDALDAIVDRLLAKSPDARFASGDEVAAALSDPALGGSTRPQPIPAAPFSSMVQSPTPPPMTPTPTPTPPRKRRWLPAVAVLGVLGAGGAAFAIVKSQTSDESTARTKAQTIDAPKVEEQKVEPPKTDAPKAETPKVEPTEPPKVEAPKPEAPKPEAPKQPLKEPQKDSDSSANLIKEASKHGEYEKAARACKDRPADRADLVVPCIMSACRVGRNPVANRWALSATTDAQREQAENALSECKKERPNAPNAPGRPLRPRRR